MGDPVPVRAAYERRAASYDSDPNATRDLDAALLRAADLPLDGARVVEIGAGTGKNTPHLAARAACVVALDLSAAMLDRARRHVRDPHVRFVEHDVTRRWPVGDGEADVVVGNLVLEHVRELSPVFREAARALRPGGILYLCEIHPYRQLRGSVARFPTAEGEARIEAYAHGTADYVGGAFAAGFELVSIAEPTAPEVRADGDGLPVPRLLQMIFRRR